MFAATVKVLIPPENGKGTISGVAEDIQNMVNDQHELGVPSAMVPDEIGSSTSSTVNDRDSCDDSNDNDDNVNENENENDNDNDERNENDSYDNEQSDEEDEDVTGAAAVAASAAAAVVDENAGATRSYTEQNVGANAGIGGLRGYTSVQQHGEDVIPTAIVIKNIPFAIKKEQLLGVIAKMELPIPYAFNYHFDNGVFRGLAFANFTTTDETTQVVQNLNGKEIGGRRLRVEYKKMLPQAERERIEREKREKRGQLEEQHRSMSNISLPSLNKISSTNIQNNSGHANHNHNNHSNSNNNSHSNSTANSNNHTNGGSGHNSNNGHINNHTNSNNHSNSHHHHNHHISHGSGQNNSASTPSQLFNNFLAGQLGMGTVGLVPSVTTPQLLSNQNSVHHTINVTKHQHATSATERYYAPLPSVSNLPFPPQQVDFNDPDILEIYSQLLLFRDREKSYHELAYPLGVTAQQKRVINVLCSFLGLVEVYDPSFIIIRRKLLDHATLQSHLQQQGQTTQPLQAHSTGGSLQRSQSYTSVLQAHAAATVAAHNSQKQQLQAQSQQAPSQPQQQKQPQQQQLPSSPGQPLLQPVASYDNLSLSQSQSQSQSQGQHLRNQGTTTSSLLQNRIPSGYATSHTPSSALLRQHGVSPPQSQVPMNSSNSTSRMASILYNPTALSQPSTPGLVSDSRFLQGLASLDGPSNLTLSMSNGASTNSTAPLIPQNTNGSVHSNYSLHSIHDYMPINSAGNNEINTLEDGLTRSLSGLDLGKRNVWS